MSKHLKDRKDIVVTGEWDGQPIWRRKTAGELLAERIEEMNKHSKQRQQEIKSKNK